MWVGCDFALGFGGATIRVIRILDKRYNGFYYTIGLRDLWSANRPVFIGKVSLYVVKTITGLPARRRREETQYV